MTEREHPPVPNYWWVGWRDARTACISQEGNINRSYPSNFKLLPKNTVQEVLDLILGSKEILIDHPKLGTRISVRPSSVMLRVPSLDSETGWTEELWMNRVILILEN